MLPLVVFNNIRSIAIAGRSVATAGSIIRSVAGTVSQVGEKVQRGKSGRYIPPDSLDHHSRCKSRPAEDRVSGEDLVMDHQRRPLHHNGAGGFWWWILVHCTTYMVQNVKEYKYANFKNIKLQKYRNIAEMCHLCV